MIDTEIAVRDLRLAAVHEASHAAILRLCGGVASPRVWPTGADDPDVKAWAGECHVFAAPLASPLANWRVLVGAAGFVGELIFRCEPELDWIAFEMLTNGDARLSESDAALIGESFTPEDIDLCATVLASLWDGVLREAQFLVSTAPAADGGA